MPLTDNTAKWGVRRLTKFQDNNGIPVGFEYFSTNPNIPAGSIPLFGGEYSRTVYADLWSWVQEQAGYLIEESEWQAKASANDGNVPYYSSGDGSTTFRVPSLKCWIKGANGIEEVGSYLQAGLPNITGTFTSLSHGLAQVQGAFNNTTLIGNHSFDDYGRPQHRQQIINFSAEANNSIYGNSDTVQPKSIVGMWLVKAYGTVSNVGSTDVADIAVGLTELETRCDAHIRVVETYNNGTNWYRVWNDGWLEQGAITKNTKTYTFLKPFANTNYLVEISLNGGSYGTQGSVYVKDTTGVTIACNEIGGDRGFEIFACGMGA